MLFSTFCVILNKYFSSNSIIFLKIIPSSFFHCRVMGLFALKTLLPLIFQREFNEGTFILFPILVQPVSTKYPFAVSWGFKNITFLFSLRFCLWFLKDISSIRPPFREIVPTIFSFSIFILSTLLIESSLETGFIFTASLIFGVTLLELSIFFSEFFFFYFFLFFALDLL